MDLRKPVAVKVGSFENVTIQIFRAEATTKASRMSCTVESFSCRVIFGSILPPMLIPAVLRGVIRSCSFSSAISVYTFYTPNVLIFKVRKFSRFGMNPGEEM